MKTPEQIQAGLDTCGRGACKDCPYWSSGGGCVNELMRDAAELIRQLKNGGETPAAREGKA